MGLVERLDHLQRRHTPFGFPIAVFYKFFDDQGSYLAALVTYYGFLSLFPLLLLLSSVLGFALQGDPHLQQQILSSALSQFPVIGNQLGSTAGLRGSGVGVVVGLLGRCTEDRCRPGGAERHERGLGHPAQQPPQPGHGAPAQPVAADGGRPGGRRHHSPVRAGVERRGVRGEPGGRVQVVLTLAAVAVNALVFLLAFRIATARELSWRDAAPGALTAAVAWQLLQSFGALYVGHVLKNATASTASSVSSSACSPGCTSPRRPWSSRSRSTWCGSSTCGRAPCSRLSPTTWTSPTGTARRTPTRPRRNAPRGSRASTSPSTTTGRTPRPSAGGPPAEVNPPAEVSPPAAPPRRTDARALLVRTGAGRDRGDAAAYPIDREVDHLAAVLAAAGRPGRVFGRSAGSSPPDPRLRLRLSRSRAARYRRCREPGATTDPQEGPCPNGGTRKRSSTASRSTRSRTPTATGAVTCAG